MITFPRSLARSCHAVLRRLASARGRRGPPPAVALEAGPDGLRLRLAAAGAAAEYRHPLLPGDARVALPLPALADCAGRDGSPVRVRPLPGGRAEVRWDHAGTPQTREYAAGGPPPPLPDWPAADAANGPGLLAALDRAAQTAGPDGTRYALHRILLRGGAGEVAATDGRQLLLEGGFTFPWDGDVLVHRATVFAAPELAAGAGEVRVARSAGHVLLRSGRWTVALQVAEGERYPDVAAAVPPARAAATAWRLGPGGPAALARALAGLPSVGGDPDPVTVGLGRAVTLRAGDGPAVTLAGSSAQGPPVVFVTDRRLLGRACALGFTEFRVAGPGRPVVCRDGGRTFVWMPLGDPAPPHPKPVARPAPAPAARVGVRRAAPAAAAPPATVGWSGRLAAWGVRLRRLADLARAQRRREPWT